MKKKIYLDEEINLREIIKVLWSEKILIFFISLIFMVTGYIYGTLQTKIFKTEIIISDAPSYFFEPYRIYIGFGQEQDLSKNFNENFRLNLLSIDTLAAFVEKNNTINDFKNHLKNKNTSVKNYFRDKLKPVIEKENISIKKYSLTYLQPLPGKDFLNDYIIFVHQQTIAKYKQHLMHIITYQINLHKEHLEIANNINLEDPISKGTNTKQSETLFFNGTKVLTQQISNLNVLLNNTKSLTFDYNPILEEASEASIITKPVEKFILSGFLLGLFFSSIVILIKKNL